MKYLRFADDPLVSRFIGYTLLAGVIVVGILLAIGE
jgi:hypothetical protein